MEFLRVNLCEFFVSGQRNQGNTNGDDDDSSSDASSPSSDSNNINTTTTTPTRRRNTNKSGKIYECQSCTKVFRSYPGLRYHRNSKHTQDGPYKCNYCEKRFCQKSHLSRHESLHTGELKFNPAYYSLVTPYEFKFLNFIFLIFR